MAKQYREVRALILREIEKGRWKAGDRLGTMKDLSGEFETSLVTLDRALRELVNDGVLIHEPNKGVRMAERAGILNGTIMLVIHNLDPATTFPDFVAGAEQVVQNRKYHLSIFCMHNQVDLCMEAAKRAVCMKAKGVIYAPGGGGTDFQRNGEVLSFLRSHNMPIVLAGHCDIDEARLVPSVASDHEKAARVLAAHLIRMGYRRYCIIGHTPNSDHDRIFKGFKSVLYDNGIELKDHDFQFCPDVTWVPGVVRRIWMSAERPEVIFSIGDDFAAAVIAGLREMGTSVPEDIAVVGFGDYPVCRYLPVPLTTMRIRHKEEGALAAGLLMDQIEGIASRITRIDVPCDLIVRQSCGSGYLPKQK